MNQEWAERVKSECEALKVAFWMKQMSARSPAEGSKLIPAHLLTRQFPEAHS
jgi:protein gp37